MTSSHVLRAPVCAICHTQDNAVELYPANFDHSAFNPAVFSARRLPDRIHYRIVKCKACGLVRSDPVADTALLTQLYAQSGFSYGGEAQNLRRTYGRYLARLNRHGARKGSLLEIGCGNGFFLVEALAQGYAVARGVEPSAEAVAGADLRVRPHIVCDVMRPGLFTPEEFDVICLFQIFDHVPDPNALLAECAHLLKRGGLMLFLQHDVEALSARVLKERSPIIDIEHTYLYSAATLRHLVSAHGLIVKESGSVRNTYSLYYLLRLLPAPPRVKHALLKWIEGSAWSRISVTVPLGNLYLIAARS